MVRERLKELVDFARAESPYRNANKGWINDDIYLQWGSLPDQVDKEGNELIDIFVFWQPIKKLVSILFLVFSLSVLLVFAAISIGEGKFEISLPIQPSLYGEQSIQEPLDLEALQPEIIEESLQPELIEGTQVISAEDADTTVKTSIEVNLEGSQAKPKKDLGSAGNLF